MTAVQAELACAVCGDRTGPDRQARYDAGAADLGTWARCGHCQAPLCDTCDGIPGAHSCAGRLAAEANEAPGLARQVRQLVRTVELLNAYGQAMAGDQWWPGNAGVYLDEQRAAELEALLESQP